MASKQKIYHLEVNEYTPLIYKHKDSGETRIHAIKCVPCDNEYAVYEVRYETARRASKTLVCENCLAKLKRRKEYK
jgi:ribosomal protein S27E